MDIDEAKEAYREDILRQLVVQNHNIEMRALFAEDVDEIIPKLSDSFELRMKKLFSNAKRKRFYNTIYSVTKRVAVILLFVITALFAVMMTVPDIRAAVQKAIVEWFDDFTRFRFDGGVSGTDDLDIVYWYPQYIPEGYTETKRVDFPTSIKIVFEDDKQQTLIFHSMRIADAAPSVAVDNEHSEFFVINEDGIDYNVFSTTDSEYPSHIIWEKSGYMFRINGYASYEDLLKMAISASVIQ